MNPSKKDFRLKFSVGAVLASLALFMLARAALFLLNGAYFSSLSRGEILSGFLNGLRFDY